MGEILVIDTNIMVRALGTGTRERSFVEQVLRQCDTIAISKSIFKEYRSAAGWYHITGLQSIWDNFENYTQEKFRKKIKKIEKSKIDAKKRALKINSNEYKIYKINDRLDYKLIDCAIGCCSKRVIVITIDSDLVGREVRIKDIIIKIMTPEEYLQQRSVQ